MLSLCGTTYKIILFGISKGKALNSSNNWKISLLQKIRRQVKTENLGKIAFPISI